ATTPSAMIERATHLLNAGHVARASRLAARAVAAGAERTGVVWRLQYPFSNGDALVSAARRAGVDPWLVSAVIRQESGFDPRATSPAGARGLMQVMPAVGRELARNTGLRDYDDALLWQPAVSLAFGTRHFADAMKRY